jgi:hypothetical protein
VLALAGAARLGDLDPSLVTTSRLPG